MLSNTVRSTRGEKPIFSSPTIEIRPLLSGDGSPSVSMSLASSDATAFRTLNEEWITRHFAENAILRKGGHIFMEMTL
ncbi:MAG TPA: hypothetical protein VNZ03_37585 [Terriglobales bacterium]|jgi:hypothetical protein|nr:hypothetical protein [Terriglobales bacterium]